MLNKEVCKRCLINYFDLPDIICWGKSDESLWKVNGYVQCRITFNMVEIDKEPPEVCAYKLEHMVMENAE